MNNTAVAERQEQAPANVVPASESAAILSVIERMAVNPDIEPERVERFIALKRQLDADVARKAFDAAVSLAKAEIPPIVRNAKGHNNKMYADFAAIASVVDPIISKFGLSYRFRTTQAEKISVTCILAHKDGHFEETTLSGPADGSGSKNAIQAIGSTLTYLQRYSLVQALGLAAATDDDGKGAGTSGEAITDEQAAELRGLIEKAGTDAEAFCKVAKINAVPDLLARDFDRAKAWLDQRIAAKAAKK